MYLVLNKMNHLLNAAEFVIKTDHKSLKYILDSPMENIKIQLWALGIAGYNCKVAYIKGTYNSCADLLPSIPQSAGLRLEKGTFEPNISDKGYKIGALNSNRFNQIYFASSKLLPEGQVHKPTLRDNVDSDRTIKGSNLDGYQVWSRKWKIAKIIEKETCVY